MIYDGWYLIFDKSTTLDNSISIMCCILNHIFVINTFVLDHIVRLDCIRFNRLGVNLGSDFARLFFKMYKTKLLFCSIESEFVWWFSLIMFLTCSRY